MLRHVFSIYSRGLKLKVSRGPHETESKVWRATLNMKKFFCVYIKFFWENRPIGPVFLLQSPFFPDVRGPQWSLSWAACLKPLIYSMHLLHVVVFEKKFCWLAQTKVITLKMQPQAVNTRCKPGTTNVLREIGWTLLKSKQIFPNFFICHRCLNALPCLAWEYLKSK